MEKVVWNRGYNRRDVKSLKRRQKFGYDEVLEYWSQLASHDMLVHVCLSMIVSMTVFLYGKTFYISRSATLTLKDDASSVLASSTYILLILEL